jgi:small subunit ribosomal protein S6
VNTYETLFVISLELEEGDINKTIDIVQDVITEGGGNILKIDKWGRRQMAYEIRKKREGYYVLMYFQAPPTLIVELNRRYKLTDAIVRNLVLQLRKDQEEDLLRSIETGENAAPAEPEGETAAHQAAESDAMQEQETATEDD